MRNITLVIVLTAVFFLKNFDLVYAGFEDTDQERQWRWHSIAKEVFNGRPIKADDKAIRIDAPDRAQDAAMVPIVVSLADPENMKALYLVIDDNPSPVAAHFIFGHIMDPDEIRLRVRVNTYTDMHAVAETKDGRLLMTSIYMKASGGCSAPMGISDEEALNGIGEMKLKLAGEVAADKPIAATLMIRHPNFNGMQQSQQTQAYTPARYIQTISVNFNGQSVFDLSSDISLASNPVIGFKFLPSAARGTLSVSIKDSQEQVWLKEFKISGRPK